LIKRRIIYNAIVHCCLRFDTFVFTARLASQYAISLTLRTVGSICTRLRVLLAYCIYALLSVVESYLSHASRLLCYSDMTALHHYYEARLDDSSLCLHDGRVALRGCSR
jgi:hypothetical protein